MAKIKIDVNKIFDLSKVGMESMEIAKIVGCAESTVSYHLKKNGLDRWKIKDSVKKSIHEYYKTHNASQTAKKFKVCRSTVKKYGGSKYTPACKGIKVSRKKAVYNWRRKAKKKALELMGGMCQNCGYNKCARSLTFHHVNPMEKDFNIAGISISWHKIKMELKKCVLVCSNCHGEIHDELYEKGFSDIVNKISRVAQSGSERPVHNGKVESSNLSASTKL